MCLSHKFINMALVSCTSTLQKGKNEKSYRNFNNCFRPGFAQAEEGTQSTELENEGMKVEMAIKVTFVAWESQREYPIKRWKVIKRPPLPFIDQFLFPPPSLSTPIFSLPSSFLGTWHQGREERKVAIRQEGGREKKKMERSISRL